MTDPVPVPVPKTLIVPSATASRELASFAETGLITADQQKALTVASSNLALMKAVSTPIGARHFNRIDTLLSVRINTPVSQAREVLSTLATVWDGMSTDFHKFRELYFEAKLRRAKANQKRKLLDDPDLTEDDRTILGAELDLEGAKIDKIEAEVAKGHAALQGTVKKATAASEQYAALLTSSGKAEFTEEDFRQEEIDYYLQSAWWHASQVFGASTVDARTKERTVHVRHDLVLYFESLNITQFEIKKELEEILAMRESFNMVHRPATRPSFAPTFDGWLKRTATKYRDRAMQAAGKNGLDKIKRITSIIKPSEDDGGTLKDYEQAERHGMTE